MKNRSTSDIIKGFVKRSGLSKEEATRFAAEFQAIFEEAILNDKIVKISGLGTFKLVLVNARRSVDVRTGESIEIAEHYKFSFTPAPQLRDQVNLPLAHLETVEMGGDATAYSEELDVDMEDNSIAEDAANLDADPMQKLTTQAIEIQSLLSDIQGLAGDGDTSDVLGTLDEEIKEEVKVVEDEVKEEFIEMVQQEDREAVVETNGDTERAEVVQMVEEQEEETESIDIIKIEEEAEKERLRREESLRKVVEAVNDENNDGGKLKWLWVILLFVLLSVLAFLILYSYTDILDKYFKSSDATSDVKELVDTNLDSNFSENLADSVIQIETDLTVVESIEMGKSEAIGDDEPQSPQSAESETATPTTSIFDEKRNYSDIITTVTVEPGSRLTLISLKYYGSKDYWVYIYEANRDILSTPNNIEIGMHLRIPRLNPLLIDTKNSATIAYAKSLQELYL
ncbi:MAG: HU family DNA-binding protein [bacterium]